MSIVLLLKTYLRMLYARLRKMLFVFGLDGFAYKVCQVGNILRNEINGRSITYETTSNI